MAEPQGDAKRLLVVILNRAELLDDLLTGFLDLGVPGATIVESRGMGQIIRQDMPIFAGLTALFPENSGTRLILSLLPQELVQPVFDLVDEVVGDVKQANTAICFTLPVDQIKGLNSSSPTPEG